MPRFVPRAPAAPRRPRPTAGGGNRSDPRQIRDNQRNAWGATAAGYERSAPWYLRNFGPAFTWLCEAAGAAPGKRLLDVACGAGQPALSAAARVAPGGSVVGIDLAPQMLDVARRQAQAAGLELELHEMGAEELTFADGSFDGATCAFALMFCPDALRAVRELRRVVAPRGRVAVAVWDEPARNPYFTTLFQSVAQSFPPAPPPDPKAPGPFRFAGSALGELLRNGGLAGVEVRSLPLELSFDSLDEHWQVTLDLAGGLRARLATLSSEELARLRARVAEALQPFLSDGRVRVTATALCGTARVSE